MTLRHLRAFLLATVSCAGCLALPAGAASAALPPIRHVFVLIDENESEATSFGPSSPAPYLAKTLVSEGAFVPNYYGVGHSSLDNYIAMVSGQAPNPATSADCPTFADFPAPATMNAAGQENGSGCVYPTNVPTLMGQLQAAHLSWRAYEDGMGSNPARDNTATTSGACGHPVVGSPDPTEVATPTDQYAARHDPFVYFHSVIDNPAVCNRGVVNLNQLPTDLASVATTPNYVFITPNLCNDGHDATGANCPTGGLAQADNFLKVWVPKITGSPAFRQNGLLIVTFDEAVGDSTACCGEQPGPAEASPGGNGPGGGRVGAVLLSPYIKAGTNSARAYNHYSMLGSVEDLFGLGRVGYAHGTASFGSDIFTNFAPTVAPQIGSLRLAPARFRPLTGPRGGTTITYRDSEPAVTTLTIERQQSGYRLPHQACRRLASHHRAPKHSVACVTLRSVGSFSHHDVAGVNRVRFTGRLGRAALASGRYVLQAVPSRNGLTGTPRRAGFTVL